MKNIFQFYAAIAGMVALAACGGGNSDTPNSVTTFRVGGTVAGLAGNGLKLRNIGGEEIAIDKTENTTVGSVTFANFAFRAELPNGAEYEVSVAAQPENPKQTCTLNNANGRVNGANVQNISVTCVTVVAGSSDTFSVGGVLVGLGAGKTLAIQNNGADTSVLSGNGSFTFANQLAANASYAVTVSAQPSSQTCAITRGVGTVSSNNIADVAIACLDAGSTGGEVPATTYPIGGAVVGLGAGKSLVFQNNGGDELTVMASGSFVFSTKLATNGAYAVAIKTQPAGQVCTLNAASGVVMAAVSTIAVTCTNTPVAVSPGPLDLDASPLSHEVTLNWDNAAAARFNVYVSSDKNCDFANYARCAAGAMVANAAAPYTVKSLQNAKGYYFRVEGVSNDGNSRWSPLVGARPNEAAFNGEVLALAAGSDGTAYLGGNFTQVGAASGGWVAFDDALSSGALPEMPMVVGYVQGTVPDGRGGVFIGGEFTHVGGQPRKNLAHILADGSVDSAWKPDPDYEVVGIAVADNSVYVSGMFRMIGGQRRGGLAQLDFVSGSSTAWDPIWPTSSKSYKDFGRGLVVLNGHVYVSRSTVSGDGTIAKLADELVEFDSAGNIIRTFPTNTVLRDQSSYYTPLSGIMALTASNGTLYVGGQFTTFGGVARRNLAAIDLASGRVTDWNPRPDEPVSALAATKERVFVGGNFAYIGDQIRRSLASFDSNGLVTNWSPPAIGGCDAVIDRDYYCIQTMSATESSVFVGGHFTKIGDKGRNGVAKIGADGEVLDWNPRVTPQRDQYLGNRDFFFNLAVLAMGNRVFVAGRFTSINSNSPRNRLAAVNAFGDVTSWAPTVNNAVYSLALNGDTIYLGGNFTSVGGESRNRLAAVSTQSSAALSNWSPNADGAVRALGIKGSTVFLGGDFANVAGQARSRLAAIDFNGSLTAWNPAADDRVWTLAISGSVVYVGGNFSAVGGQSRRSLAAIGVNGILSAWQPVDSNCYSSWDSGCVESIVVVGNTVYVGGSVGLNSYDGTGQHVSTFAGENSLNYVNALAAFGDGILVGNEFNSDHGESGLSLTSLTGALNKSWSPEVFGEVNAITVFGNSILVGGGFVGAGGAPRGGFAVVNFDGTVR